MSEENTVNRRNVLKSASVVPFVAIAGCGSAGDGSDGDGESPADGQSTPADGTPTEVAGEPVELTIDYWTGQGSTTAFYERSAEAIQDNLEELGAQVELTATDFATAAGNLVNDAREMQTALGFNANSLGETLTLLRWNMIDFAGGNGLPNLFQYADCEYSEAVHNWQQAATPEEEEEFRNLAQSIISEACVSVPLTSGDEFTAGRIDRLEVGRVGMRGIHLGNPISFMTTERADGETLTIGVVPATIETTNHFQIVSTQSLSSWSQLIYSPLTFYDENYEIANVLAENIEVSEDGVNIVVELRDGAVFHNGDPVTADDVAFTFQYMSDNADAYLHASSLPLDSINVIDENTTEFVLETPHPMNELVFPKWGIVPKSVWDVQDAHDDPEGFSPDEIIGSGPYEVSSITLGENLILTPTTEQHPMFNPTHDLFLQSFREANASVESLQAGEIDVASEIPMSAIEVLQEGENTDVFPVTGVSCFHMYLQYPEPPTKFREFRVAVATVMDRVFINQLATSGLATPQTDTMFWSDANPFKAPKDMLFVPTDDPSGDVEAARQVLADAGWTWDEDEVLHYPADIDLTPKWPAGEVPNPDDYDCLNEDGTLTF